MLTSYAGVLGLNRGASVPEPSVREAPVEGAQGSWLELHMNSETEKPSDPGSEWEAVLCRVLDL